MNIHLKSNAMLRCRFSVMLFAVSLFIVSCSTNSPDVIMETEMGDIGIKLYAEQAPVTVSNFMRYAESDRYSNLAQFYRVVTPSNQPNAKYKIAVIQGGFYSDSLIAAREFTPIEHENTAITGIKHTDGIISMARAEIGTASSEFFICIGNQPELDYGGQRNPDGQGFAAFGRVVKGMDIVRKIHGMENENQYLTKPVRIVKIRRCLP